MAEHGFTPGPWAVDAKYLSEVQTAGDKTIASCWHEWADDQEIRVTGVLRCSLEESAANARLIAASPTLLEALEPFSGWDFTGTAWEHAAGHEAVLFDHKTGRTITLDDFRAVTAAITLATGEPK